MLGLEYDNQGDALSRDVPDTALALIDEGGNGASAATATATCGA